MVAQDYSAQTSFLEGEIRGLKQECVGQSRTVYLEEMEIEMYAELRQQEESISLPADEKSLVVKSRP